jgi:hypothetical protein
MSISSRSSQARLKLLGRIRPVFGAWMDGSGPAPPAAGPVLVPLICLLSNIGLSACSVPASSPDRPDVRFDSGPPDAWPDPADAGLDGDLDTSGPLDVADAGADGMAADADCPPSDYSVESTVLACGLSGPMAVCSIAGRLSWLTYTGTLVVDGATELARPGARFAAAQCGEDSLVWIDTRANEILSYDGRAVSVTREPGSLILSAWRDADGRLSWSTFEGSVRIRDGAGVTTATTADARISNVALHGQTLSWVRYRRPRELTVFSRRNSSVTSTTVVERAQAVLAPGPLVLTNTGTTVASYTYCSTAPECRSPQPSCCSSHLLASADDGFQHVAVPYPGTISHILDDGGSFVLAMPNRLVRWTRPSTFDVLFETPRGTPRFSSRVGTLHWVDPRLVSDVVRDDGLVLRARD